MSKKNKAKNASQIAKTETNDKIKKKIDYLKEHVTYELMMLRYSYNRMLNTNSHEDRNSFYESFAIHARNLYLFLRNEGDNTTYNASDFAENYPRPKTPTVSGIAQKINRQVTHMSSLRTVQAEEKVSFQNTRTLAEWIEQQMKVFAQNLDKPYLSHFDLGTHSYSSPKSDRAITASSATASSAITVPPKALIPDADLTFKTK